MGTFIIRPTTHNSGGIPLIISPGLPPDDYAGYKASDASTVLQAIQSLVAAPAFLDFWVRATNAPNALTDTIRFDFLGSSIYLDGAVIPIAFNSLPPGFTLSDATISFDVSAAVATSGSIHFYAQGASGNNGPEDTQNYTYDMGAFPTPTMLDVVNNGCGIRIVANVTSFGVSEHAALTAIRNLRVIGNYTTDAFQWTLNSPTNGASIGDEITITSTNGGLDEIDTITLTANGITIEVILEIQTPDLIMFFMPSGFGNFSVESPIIVDVVATVNNGTQFSGSVTLGTLSLLFVDASGIYVLIKDKRTDTLYDRIILNSTLTSNFANGVDFIDINYDENFTELVDGINGPIGLVDLNELNGTLGMIKPPNYYSEDLNNSNYFEPAPTQVIVSTNEFKIQNPLFKLGFIGG